MKILLLFLILYLFSACYNPNKDIDFIFSKFNIREAYYLKFNASDTLYYSNVYPLEAETSYTILNTEEKEKITNLLESLTFPKNEEFINNTIEDGQTYLFFLKKNNQSKYLRIHGQKGPKQFWLFGKYLEEIKTKHKFTQINIKIDLSEIKKTFFVPPPPIVK